MGQANISIKGKWVSVPALSVNGKSVVVKGSWLKTAVVHDEEWSDTEIGDPQVYVKRLQENREGVKADIFSFTQKPPATTPRYDYVFEGVSIAAACYSSFKEWWESLPQETRKNVRRAEKRGVIIKTEQFSDALVQGIVKINNESPIRQGKAFTHYGKTFEQVKKDYSAFLDRSEFICAYFEGELIGFLQVIYRGDIASLIQLYVLTSHYDKRPSNALLAKAIELCDQKGIRCFTYGMFNYGNKGHTPLREFKIRNRFKELIIPRYYVPLTDWGALCLKLGFHRGLLGVLPEPVIVAGNRAREKWYSFKSWLSRCSSMLEQPNRIRQTGRSNPPTGSNL